RGLARIRCSGWRRRVRAHARAPGAGAECLGGRVPVVRAEPAWYVGGTSCRRITPTVILPDTSAVDLPLFLVALSIGALAAWLACRSRVARLEERLDAE